MTSYRPLAKVSLALFAAALFLAIVPANAQRSGGGQRRDPAVPRVPPPAADDDSAAQDQAGSTVKTETVIVPVRVVVRDSQGHAVLNLTKDNFKLYQDGKQQSMLNFVAIAPAAKHPYGRPPSTTTAVDTSSAIQAAPITPPQRFVTLLFDDVHLSLGDLIRARNAADEYLASLEPEDRAAVLTVSGQGQQDFTSDRPALHAALLKLLPHAATAGDPNSAGACPPMDFFEADAIANQNSSQVLGLATQDALNCAYDGETEFRRQAQDMALRAADQMMTAADEETEAVLRRLREVARRVTTLPGERDVVFVSPGLIYPGREMELSEIIDRAVEDGIVVNTLDARGLYAPGAYDVTQRGVARNGAAQATLDGYRLAGETLANNVLAELADGTGGLSFRDNNDFNAAFRELAAAPELYYVLAYSPRNLKTDGHYHHLKVTLNGKDNYVVESRHGFYAPLRLESAEVAANREIQDAVFSQDQLNDLPVSAETRVQKTASGGEQLDVLANLDFARLHFHKVEGLNQESLTFVAALFDENGNYVTGTQKTLNFSLKDATLTDLIKTGGTSELDLDVKPGVYFLRFVARDSNDQHLSAVNATVDVPQ